MPAAASSEIRKDYVQEKYVIISPRRAERPRDVAVPPAPGAPTSNASCVFCPAQAKQAFTILTIGPEDSWQIKVIPNKYPAVSLDNPRAYGAQEVVIETPDHVAELEQLSTDHVAELLRVYALRTADLTRNPKLEYIMIFKNNGGTAGASLSHAHSQVFATSFIPPHLFDKSQRVQAYKLQHGRCVYCDVIERETHDTRLVWQDERVIAFCPYAAMYNYEVWIMPKRHLDNVTQLTAEERRSWAAILRAVLLKIDSLGLPYNYYFHQVVHDEDQHLYMKVTPRGSVWAGVEVGSGIIINPVAPETAASYYREGLAVA